MPTIISSVFGGEEADMNLKVCILNSEMVLLFSFVWIFNQSFKAKNRMLHFSGPDRSLNLMCSQCPTNIKEYDMSFALGIREIPRHFPVT